MKRNLTLMATLVLTVLPARHSPAADGPFNDRIEVIRLPNNPIIRPEMLPGRDGENINGPSLIRAPAWLAHPLGKYYLYFASHSGKYIRLAFADHLEGPWKIYEPGTLKLEEAPGCKGHIASPEAIVDDASQEIRLYFHGPAKEGRDQNTFVAVSKDGLDFKASAEILGLFYWRVFRWDGWWYGMAKGGYLYRSRNGLTAFEKGPTPFPPGALRDKNHGVRHVAVLQEGSGLWIYYTNMGDAPERIFRCRLELAGDWKTWKTSDPEEVLRPEAEWEGARLPVKASASGPANGPENALRDPCVFVEEGRVYLLYSVSGERGIAIAACKRGAPAAAPETSGGWKKFEGNPVMGGKYGTCFDVSVLREGDTYRMWLSWRPQKSVALVESKDGIRWSEPPQIVLGPRQESGWEEDINRPCVLKRADGYHMWYTGQAKGHSWIGYATSPDGVTWKRMSDKPVLSFDQPWEKNIAVMCPSVLWNAQEKLFRMWYSGGEQNEPNAIGAATSADGLAWKKHGGNPVFTADPKNPWEKHKVTACQVERLGDWHVMFYIGFENEATARICLARSRDGVADWQRHPSNPIIFPGKDTWDHDACYKPYALFDGTRWLLWYNGRRSRLEQIGVALHEGADLGFDQEARP